MNELEMLEEIEKLNSKHIGKAWAEGRLYNGRYLITFESGDASIYEYKNGVSLGYKDVAPGDHNGKRNK